MSGSHRSSSPADTAIEVGGGAGRVGLPVALRCAHLTNVEPSRGMGEQFTASALDAAIANVTLVPEPWPAGGALVADIVLTEDVSYFVEDIEPFISALAAAAQRRVVMGMWSVPPPNRNAALFELVFGEPKAPVPGHQQLLPVLWEMGILPDIVVVRGDIHLARSAPADSRRSRHVRPQCYRSPR